MRGIIVLALVSLAVINAAPLTEDESKRGAAGLDLSRKFDPTKTMLEKYGAKYDRTLMGKMMHRGKKLPTEARAAFVHEKTAKRDVPQKLEDKFARMQPRAMLDKSVMKEKFMSFKKQHETAPTAAKLKTLDDVKNFKLSKSYRDPKSVQLPEKFQRKIPLL